MLNLNLYPSFIVEEFHYRIIDGKRIRVIDKMKMTHVSVCARGGTEDTLRLERNAERRTGSNPVERT